MEILREEEEERVSKVVWERRERKMQPWKAWKRRKRRV